MEGVRLLRIRTQEAEVRIHVRHPCEQQPALKPTDDGRAPIAPEVVAGAAIHLGEDRLERLFRDATRSVRRVRRRFGLEQAHELGAERGGAEHSIHHAGANRRERHALVIGLLGLLCQRDPADLLDSPETLRAVAAGTGEHDGSRQRTVGLGQRAKEEVDRRAVLPRWWARAELDPAVHAGKVALGRNHVDVVRLQLRGPAHLDDRHPGPRLEHLRDVALPVGREMHDDDVRDPRARGCVLEEPLECDEAPGRGSQSRDGDHGEYYHNESTRGAPPIHRAVTSASSSITWASSRPDRFGTWKP